jgi:hypothetical protein
VIVDSEVLQLISESLGYRFSTKFIVLLKI